MGVAAFVGDEYLSVAFRLIGLEAYTVFDEIEAEKTINMLLDRDDLDLLVLPESLYIKLVGRHFKFRREGKEKPILAVIPGLDGSVGKRTEDLYNLISQAVGVRLELGR
jgi:vacuolar-type H+-ATPase subunit F/Vma7